MSDNDKELASIDKMLNTSADLVQELLSLADQGKIEVILNKLALGGYPEIGAVYHLGLMYVARRRQEKQ